MEKPTFKTFNTSYEKLNQAIQNVLSKKIADAMMQNGCGRVSAHRMAIEEAFVNGTGSADDHYHLRSASKVLHFWDGMSLEMKENK